MGARAVMERRAPAAGLVIVALLLAQFAPTEARRLQEQAYTQAYNTGTGVKLITWCVPCLWTAELRALLAFHVTHPVLTSVQAVAPAPPRLRALARSPRRPRAL